MTIAATAPQRSAVHQMMRWTGLVVLLLLIAFGFYAASGYVAALQRADKLAARADTLIAQGRGAEALGPGRAMQLLQVEDPGFLRHDGVDRETPGAGLTTVTQSLARRVGFSRFRSGLAKVRLTTFAYGLERRLSKEQILTLYLDTAEMGYAPGGSWMVGFFNASQKIYGKAPADLDDRRFLSLVAVLIAPSDYDLARPGRALERRVDRIEHLIAGSCRPHGPNDVWFEDCA